MKTTTRRVAALAAALTTLLAAGCGGVDYPETVPVEGTVLYKGKPVEGANVSFFTNGAPRAAYGVTDDQGHFALSTFGSRDGAIPGEHIAIVSKPGETPAPSGTPSNQPPKPEDITRRMQEAYKTKAKPDNKLPAKYADQKTSPLKYTVTKDAPNNFSLELTD
jgi:hypothetical protein